MPGPDFPTHGEIVGTEGSAEMHRSGTGTIILRGKAEVVDTDKGKPVILITELPYLVIKSGQMFVVEM